MLLRKAVHEGGRGLEVKGEWRKAVIAGGRGWR